MSQKSADEARAAGRGVLFIAGAKAYFMVAGAAIEIALPSILGASVFGAYKVVVSTVSPVNNVLITGTIQAVSRFTAQTAEKARAIQRAGLLMQLMIGLPIAVAFAALSPVMAGFFHDASKIGPIALAAAIVLTYAFYAVFVGTANGRKEFHKQAGLDVTFATLRAAGIVGLSALGFGLYGAIGGWVLAAAGIVGVSAWAVGVPRGVPAAERVPLAPMARFFAGVTVFLILFNLIMFVDTMLLKRLGAEWFAAHPEHLAAWSAMFDNVTDAASAADAQVGFYGAVQTLARLSYQAIIAAMFVVFPLVSRATFENDRAATERYIHTTMRYALIFASAIAVVFAANPHAILDIPYKTEFADMGQGALVALALGNVAFSLFAIVGTILNGAGRTRAAIALAVITLMVAIAGNAVVIPRMDAGPDALLACALVTTGAMTLGCVLGGVLLWRGLGAFVAPLTVARVALAGAGAIALGRALPMDAPLLTVIEAGIVGVAFLAILIVTRELGAADLRAVKGLAGRNKTKGGES